MSDSIQNEDKIEQKAKRSYNRRIPQQAPAQPIAPNPHVIALEGDYVQLVRQRQGFVMALNAAMAKVNQANIEREAAANELAQIDGNINFIAASISQLQNGGMPVPSTPYVSQNLQQFAPSPYGTGPSQAGSGYAQPSPPYNPVVPYPSAPSFGVSSFPGRNDGLYPDAAPRGIISDNPEDRINTGSAVDLRSPDLIPQFMGGR